MRELERADLILHGGDIATIEALRELEQLADVAAVYGNADEPALRETLPKERVVEVGEVRIGMVHIPGPRAGRETRLAQRFPGCRAVVYGHTHLPKVEQHAGIWILNPGSPTERRRGPFRSMLVLDVRGRGVRPRLVELA